MKSERPIAENLAGTLKGADYSGLEKSDNYSTGDSNMARQREQAHREALASEQAHFNTAHDEKPRELKPKPQVEPAIQVFPSDNTRHLANIFREALRRKR